MKRAPGFTLLELMLAIVLTGVVVLLAYASAQVSFDARARLRVSLRAAQSARAMRELLQDALRNAQLPQRPGDPGFLLQGARLSFVTAGGGPPLDADYDWVVTLEPDAGGLRVEAMPLGRAPPAQVSFVWPDVTRWDVRVLGAWGPQWLETWRSGMTLPRAVAIRFWHDSAAMGPPLYVSLAPSSPVALDSEDESP